MYTYFFWDYHHCICYKTVKLPAHYHCWLLLYCWWLFQLLYCFQYDHFGVSDAIDEIWISLDLHKPMKIRENPENAFLGLWGFFACFSHLHFLNVFLFPRTFRQPINKYENLHQKMKLEKDIWLSVIWPNPYNFLTMVVQHGRLHQVILWRFDQNLHLKII